MRPLILINFKTYKESSGNRGLKLAQRISKVKSNKYQIAVAPSLLTVKEIAEKVNIPVFAQHADNVELGAHTGSIPPRELKEIGIQGVILNHSEYKVNFPYLRNIVKLCQHYHLITVVCASNLVEIKHIAELNPDYIAYEPPELIGGDISVTEANPEIITRAVKMVGRMSSSTKMLCGAGIHSPEDLHQALSLGANGVLLAHAVVKAPSPRKFLNEFLG
ncbi:triose-phosphate isomerase [Candidatus Woesearchaeota archaeon]|nr:triose-phosphate isomerase [Candidatus Woesearchaeota archaeon]